MAVLCSIVVPLLLTFYDNVVLVCVAYCNDPAREKHTIKETIVGTIELVANAVTSFWGGFGAGDAVVGAAVEIQEDVQASVQEIFEAPEESEQNEEVCTAD